MFRTLRAPILLATLGLLAACDRPADRAAPAWPTAISTPRPGFDDFNPQPDPPAILSFTLAGELTEAMRGTFSDPGCSSPGTLTVGNALPAVQRGVTLHVTQSWGFVQPGPCRALGSLLLQGIVNTASGQVVLNGRTATGSPVHVLGTLTSVGGAAQIVGRIVISGVGDGGVEDPNLRGVEDPNQR